MQTRRDLYQAHQLMMQRVGLALLHGEPDVAESPMRRLSAAAVGGLMLAIIIGAIFGIIGWVSPGGAQGLDKGGVVIIEKETGAKYIYDTNGKQLLPVVNYASARLAITGTSVTQRVVSRKSLAQFKRGPTIGIQGAPDSLPDPGRLVRKPWSICDRNGQTAAGGTRPTTSLVAGIPVGGQPLGGGGAVVVQASIGQAYMIWNNQKLAMGIQSTVIVALNHGSQPVTVSAAWLNSIPDGDVFKDPDVPNRGAVVSNGPRGGGRVGQVFETSGDGATKQAYVLLQDGLAPLTQTQADLLMQNPDTVKAYAGETPTVKQISSAEANAVHQSSTQVLSQGLPKTMPAFASWNPSDPLCVVYANPDQGDMQAQLSIGGSVPALNSSAAAAQGTLADQVVLPAGGAALAGLLAGPGQQNQMNTFYIINDQGRRFGVTGDAATKLGYDVKKAAPVPKAVLALIPEGPALDPKRATTPVAQLTLGGS